MFRSYSESCFKNIENVEEDELLLIPFEKKWH